MERVDFFALGTDSGAGCVSTTFDLTAGDIARTTITGPLAINEHFVDLKAHARIDSGAPLFMRVDNRETFIEPYNAGIFKSGFE